MKVHHFLFAAICILLMAISCQKEPQVVKVESVSLNTTSLTLVEGDSQSLTATVSPSNADNKKVSWSSSNSSVATVDDRGTVTAIAPGTATITAKTEDGGKTATCSVTVNSRVISVESVSLDKTELELIEGDKATLVATVLPENADNKNVIWNSSNEEIATVEDGVVTAIKEGEATITAKTEDGEKTATCSVTVIDKSKIKPLCFTADGEQSVSLKNVGGNAPKLQYSYDGNTWTDWDYSALSFGTNEHKFVFIRGNNPNGFSQTTEKYSSFSFSTSCKVQCTGNVMHLLNYSKDLTKIPNSCCFYALFSGCTALIKAPELPATTLADNCYLNMFSGCTSLVTAPELPATTLADMCYYFMFSNCTSLVNAPELPATTLADNCYLNMFSGCTSLVTAPELPATTLADMCYENMFSGCTSLVEAPELPATTLADFCYFRMFHGCSNLNYVKALFETTPSETYTNSWLSGVSSTGTFVKSKNATWDVKGPNGIPEGWTVQIAE